MTIDELLDQYPEIEEEMLLDGDAAQRVTMETVLGVPPDEYTPEEQRHARKLRMWMQTGVESVDIRA